MNSVGLQLESGELTLNLASIGGVQAQANLEHNAKQKVATVVSVWGRSDDRVGIWNVNSQYSMNHLHVALSHRVSIYTCMHGHCSNIMVVCSSVPAG